MRGLGRRNIGESDMSGGMQGIFNTAVRGMQAQSHFMSNISMNIANVNTTGYKTQDTHFATLLNHKTPISQSFFSVNTFDYRQVDQQGNIATTNRTFDVALNGRGLFVTNQRADGTGEFQYTRDGAFFGRSVDLGVDSDGNDQNDQGTLLVTASGNYVYGWAADENGAVSEVNDISTLTPIMFSNTSVFESRATSTIALQANIAAGGAKRQSIGLPFVDSTGVSRTLAVGFTPNIDRTWTVDMEAIATDTSVVPVDFFPATLSFDGKGQLVDPEGGLFSATVHDADGDQELTLDFSKLQSLGGGGEQATVYNIDHDGYIEGRLNNTYFDKTGMLIGSYTNGEKRNLFKLATARFTAENNLEARGGNMFERTQAAGELQISGISSQIGRTELVVGALESSNVDLADQFSKMIITQRAYTSSATVLRTADEMTMAARDLKR
jgi:flagellar hook protein FlgE